MDPKVTYVLMFPGVVLKENYLQMVKELYLELLLYETDLIPETFEGTCNTSEEALGELIDNVEGCLLFLYDGAPAGLLTTDRGAPTEIAGLYVKEPYRNKQLGAAMVRCWAAVHDHARVGVTCFVENVGAKRFYERLGFVFDKATVLTTKGYWDVN